MPSEDYSFTQADLQPVRASPLHLAASAGNVNRVRQCLAAGDEVDALCHMNFDAAKPGVAHAWSPLYCSAGSGHTKIVKMLLNAGANPSFMNPGDGTSVLYVAALNGNVQVVTMLIKARAVVNWTDHKNRTALFGAAYAGHEKVVQALLSARATVDIANYEGYTPLMTSSSHGHEKCVRLLLGAGANSARIGFNHGFTALLCGANGGHAAVVQTLLRRGANVNSKSSDGMSALHLGAQAGNVDVISELLGAGIGVDVSDPRGCTALFNAAYFGHDRVVKALLSARATLDVQDHMGNTALSTAAFAGKDDVVKTLLRWGASVDTANSLRMTPLFTGVATGHAKTVKLLLDAGADPYVQGPHDATVLMFAIDLPTVKVLLEAGVSATAIDDDGNSALHHIGMRGGSVAMLCAVFKAGANPTMLNNAGHTAAQAAREKGQDDAAMLLDILVAKCTHTEEGALEAKDNSSALVLFEGKISSCVVANTLLEYSQDAKKKRPRKVRPCLNCKSLTHRRCAR